MNKLISHYIARFDMPAWRKGARVDAIAPEKYPDVFAPVYKEDPVIPPGVIKMYHDGIGCRYTTFGPGITHTYEQWHECFAAMGYKPHTISVNGTEWTCGDKTNKGEIIQLEYMTYSHLWMAKMKSDMMPPQLEALHYIKDLTKPSTRTPICQLPDENGKMVDLFEGDSYYEVGSDFIIEKIVLNSLNGKPCTGKAWHLFATLTAAEKYIRDTKPQVPWGPIERLINLRLPLMSDYSKEVIEELKKFKP